MVAGFILPVKFEEIGERHARVVRERGLDSPDGCLVRETRSRNPTRAARKLRG
jgi:hypothetical protein